MFVEFILFSLVLRRHCYGGTAGFVFSPVTVSMNVPTQNEAYMFFVFS